METAMKICCKFRVLSITSSWDDSTVANLKACTAKDISYDENGRRVRRDNPENEKFWKYTPSGEADLAFKKGTAVPSWVDKGTYAYVYLDTSGAEGEPWDVSLHLFPSGGLEVEASTYTGRLKFNLSEEHARPVIKEILSTFLLAHAEALERMPEHRPVRWGVSFVPTEEPAAVLEG
jgi:hypothetical protein